ncbi:MAG: glycosyltransferase family 9 protein [Thermodesulfobacteria bacterium]|nr:glycosyltransferase family 9 protein [Thermodesulfobacteriota bacterium]
MKILVVKLSALGDVVQTLPSLSLFKKCLPSAEIDWVVDERNAGILKGHPLINKVIVFSKTYLKSFKSVREFLRNLREKSYDFVLDYQGLLKSGIITGFARGKKKVGFKNSRELSWIFYDTKLPPYDPEMHAVKRYLVLTKEVLKMCGVEVEVGEIPDVVWQEEFLKPRIWEGDYIVVVPGARWKTKLWELDYWEEFIKLFKAEFPEIKVVISGSKSEIEIKKWAEYLEKGLKGVKSFVGRVDLKGLVNLLAYSKVVVTVDTGPMHIASALKVPIVALFGPTSERRTGPWSPIQRVITSKVPCRPCFKKECKEKVCMKKIKPKEVFKEVLKTFNS